MTVTFAPVHDDAEIDKTISIFAREPGGGLICPLDSFTLTHRDVIVSEAASHGIPLIGGNLGFPGVGGLMTYWPDPSGALANYYCSGNDFLGYFGRSFWPAPSGGKPNLACISN